MACVACCRHEKDRNSTDLVFEGIPVSRAGRRQHLNTGGLVGWLVGGLGWLVGGLVGGAAFVASKDSFFESELAN